MLTVHPSVPVRSFQEFIEYAKKANPPLAYASAGNGRQHQMTMEMLKQRAGIDLVHVPYKGGGPASAATVAGETAAVLSGSSTAAQIKAGKLRALAVYGAHRSPRIRSCRPSASSIPASTTIWLGLFGPAGMPQAAGFEAARELKRALESAETQEKIKPVGGLDPFVAARRSSRR